MFERALGVSVILNLELKEKKIIFRLQESESGKKAVSDLFQLCRGRSRSRRRCKLQPHFLRNNLWPR